MSKSQRLLSLDILRGVTVAGMILVNNGFGESFHPLQHSKWNGMTPCDLVFPFFLFIMGVSTYLSLSKYNFQMSGAVIRKIVKRTVLLFLIGLFINWFHYAIKGDLMCFDHLRVWAVLQRIALCYGIVSVLALTINHRYILHVVAFLLIGYGLLLWFGNGYAQDSSNILAQVDNWLFGREHLYQKSPIDPEGLVGTISSVAHTLIGFYCGMMLKKAKNVDGKVSAFLLAGAILVIGGYLLSFLLPLNKRIWSPSYVLMTCGLAALLQGILMYVIDVQGKKKWCTFFHVFGVNPLFLYASSEILSILLGHIGVSDWVYERIHGLIPSLQWASLAYAIYFVLLNFILGYILYKRKIYIKL